MRPAPDCFSLAPPTRRANLWGGRGRRIASSVVSRRRRSWAPGRSMARDSPIEWTGHTFNPWWGCTKVSPACDHCYAEVWARRTGHQVWGSGSSPASAQRPATGTSPCAGIGQSAASGRRARVFCASMADVFEWRPRPGCPAGIGSGLSSNGRLISTGCCSPNDRTWLAGSRPGVLPIGLGNVWLGTTVENQHFADRRIRHVLDVPCRYRFLSCEPLLGSVDLCRLPRRACTGSSRGERAADALGPRIPTGSVGSAISAWPLASPSTSSNGAIGMPAGDLQEAGHARPITSFVRMSKKGAGRVLDGRTWDELPHGYSDRPSIRRSFGRRSPSRARPRNRSRLRRRCGRPVRPG